MARDGQLTAQLGCGALILVIIAAYIGAMAGTDRVRSAGTTDSTAPALPSIFRPDKLVMMGITETGGQTPVPVLRVVEVKGTWVKFRVDVDASVTRLRPYANASEEERAKLRENYAQSAIEGEWWLNLAASTVTWAEYK